MVSVFYSYCTGVERGDGVRYPPSPLVGKLGDENFRREVSKNKTYTLAQGRTLLLKALHTNASILCHEMNLCPAPLLSRAPAVPLIRLTPRGEEHPAELHHLGTMIPRHERGHLRYKTPDLRRPVSKTSVSQQPPYSGLDTTGPGKISQMPGKRANPN